MWNKKISNYICNYLSEYQIQKKHIERVLSAKEIVHSRKSPYKPKFLKLKQCKLQMEEDKNNKIREENRQLFYKIIDAEIKPSLYSKIYKPKESPSFDKNVMQFKRVKKELKTYEDNIRIYKKIEKVKSFYENKILTQRNRNINDNIKRLQKSILELQPSLLFSSPQAVKKQMEKYKHLNYNISQTKRCNSCRNRQSSKIISDKKKDNIKEKGENKNNPTISNDSTLNKFSSLNEILPGKNNNNKENSKIIEKNLNNLKETIKKIKEKENENKNGKNEKNKNESKKLNLSIDKSNSKNNNVDNNFSGKEKPKTKKIKFGLKRNSSEVNIFS